MTCNAIYKGDNTASFGGRFLEIEIENNTGYEISRAIFVSGCIKKELDLTQDPIGINLNSEETRKLLISNVGYLIVFDEYGRQRTAEGTVEFPAKNGVI